jgi:hypothetical protein
LEFTVTYALIHGGWSNNGQEPPDDYDRCNLNDAPRCKNCTHYKLEGLVAGKGACQKRFSIVSEDYRCDDFEFFEF